MPVALLPVIERPLPLPLPPSNYREPFVLGNDKLGPLVAQFALPPIDTCPGRSPSCEGACYACRGSFLYANVTKRQRENDAFRHELFFTSRCIQQIRRTGVSLVRIHTAGDFDEPWYIEKWLKIVQACPTVTFWAYTRSWRVPELLPLLRTLSREPNFQMWWSCDTETGAPPRTAGVYRAYMAADDLDVPAFKVDLVFRVKRHLKLPIIADTLVCPAERKQHKKGEKHVTCTECRICFERTDWLDKFNAQVRAKAN